MSARKENESFEDYKARQKLEAKAVKDINKDSRSAKGQPSPRSNRPGKGIIALSYGNMLRAHFAKQAKEKLNAKKEVKK